MPPALDPWQGGNGKSAPTVATLEKTKGELETEIVELTKRLDAAKDVDDYDSAGDFLKKIVKLKNLQKNAPADVVVKNKAEFDKDIKQVEKDLKAAKEANELDKAITLKRKLEQLRRSVHIVTGGVQNCAEHSGRAHIRAGGK